MGVVGSGWGVAVRAGSVVGLGRGMVVRSAERGRVRLRYGCVGRGVWLGRSMFVRVEGCGRVS